MQPLYSTQLRPFNLYSYFVALNPSTSFNKQRIWPRVSKRALLSPFSFTVGNVRIRRGVYVGPFVSIRADEGTPFYIGKNTNLQDGVILHGIKDKYFEIDNEKFSVFIGEEVSCAHGALIHGPSFIGNNVFVGFQSIIFDATVGEGSFVSSNAVVTNGVILRPNSFVPPGASIDSQEKADSLSDVPKNKEEFAKEVQRVNKEFPPSYSILFGNAKCSCGLAYIE